MTAPAGEDRSRRVLIEVPAWVASLGDAGVRAVGVLVLLLLVGFAMLGLAWRGAARTVYVPLQLPWVVSGGVAGLALVGLAAAAWSIHLGRREDAAHRAAVEVVVREAAELAEDLRSGRRALPRSRRR